jgi:FMN-dependent NADH-azoreductase
LQEFLKQVSGFIGLSRLSHVLCEGEEAKIIRR